MAQRNGGIKSWFDVKWEDFRKPVVIGYYHNIDPRTGRALVASLPEGQAPRRRDRRKAASAAGR